MIPSLFNLARSAVDPTLVNEIVMAVDFGDKGGFVWNVDGKILHQDMTEIRHISALLRKVRPNVLVGEDVHSMPKQGVVSVATFMRGVGQIEGACSALGIKVALVPPQEWMKWYEFGKRSDFIGKNGKPSLSLWKNHLKTEASNRFPGVKVSLNIADALLIWNYWNNPARIRKISQPSFS